MNIQHFQGSGGDNNGRIRIRLDPEVVPGNLPEAGEPVEDETATNNGTNKPD
jgi:hypothetical protein